MNTVHYSSNTDLYATPQAFFNELDTEFHFTLDPCATEDNAKCKTFFTEALDGLKQSWKGHTVFCNPPYSNLKAWVKKASEESKHATVVMLIPARTDTIAFHQYIYGKAEIRFIKGRLKFGDSKNSAPFPSMIVVFKKLVLHL